MGATTSAQVASNFFMGANRDVNSSTPEPISHTEAAPIHNYAGNKLSKTVSEEGVKLLPGGDSVSPPNECPMHQIGDGKGVAGKLRIIDTAAKEKSNMRLQKEILSPKSLDQHKEKTFPSPEVKTLHVENDLTIAPSLSKSLSESSQCPMHKEKSPVKKPTMLPSGQMMNENVSKVIPSTETSQILGQTMNTIRKPLPSECPMSKAVQPQKSPSPASFPSACPMSQGEDKAKAKTDDLNTDNMVSVIHNNA